MSTSDSTVRPLALEDLPAIAELWQTATTYDPANELVLREKIFDDPRVTDSLRIGDFKDGQLTGFAVGVIGQHACIKLIAVNPRYQLQQRATRLLRAIESEFSQASATEVRVGESAPNYLTPGIDIRNTSAIGFFKKHGYEMTGDAYNQHVDLSGSDWDSTELEAKLSADESIHIERATSSLARSLHQLLEQHWPSWQAEVDKALHNSPATVFVATYDSKVIAFAAHDANNLGTGWFGPMGTDPEYAGRGIGRILLWRCLGEMRQQGHVVATIPWVGPTGFYEKHAAATISQKFVRMRKQL